MKEAKEEEAYLSELDTTTFRHFINYIYKGNYYVHDSKEDVDKKLRLTLINPEILKTRILEFEGIDKLRLKCTRCGKARRATTPNLKIFEHPGCRVSKPPLRFCVKCGTELACQSVVCGDCAAFFKCFLGPSNANLFKSFKAQRFHNAGNPRPQAGQQQNSQLPADSPWADPAEHIRLYIFADCYDVSGLRELCLRKLHRTLCGYKPVDASQIVNFAAAIYSSTGAHPQGTDNERWSRASVPLRDLISKYAACYARSMLKKPAFRAEWESNEDFARDLLRHMAQRVAIKFTV